MKDEKQLLDKVLAWVNEMRGYKNMRPLKRLNKGRPHSPAYCSIAKSLPGKAKAFPTLCMFADGEFQVVPPKEVGQFMWWFDDGHLPQLELKR